MKFNWLKSKWVNVWVKNDLQLPHLMKLDPIIQTEFVMVLSMGHSKSSNIEDLDAQTSIYQKIVSQNLSVRYRSLS
jgi:hypothetical protein